MSVTDHFETVFGLCLALDVLVLVVNLLGLLELVFGLLKSDLLGLFRNNFYLFRLLYWRFARQLLQFA